jgi:hypothetical protein
VVKENEMIWLGLFVGLLLSAGLLFMLVKTGDIHIVYRHKETGWAIITNSEDVTITRRKL